MTKFTFKRVPASDLSEYTVYADGAEVGRVWKAWFRLGGNSWTNNLIGSGGCPTRLAAARDLMFRHRNADHKPTD